MYYGMERSTYQWQLHATALRPWMSLSWMSLSFELPSFFHISAIFGHFRDFRHLGRFTRKTTISPFFGGFAATGADFAQQILPIFTYNNHHRY